MYRVVRCKMLDTVGIPAEWNNTMGWTMNVEELSLQERVDASRFPLSESFREFQRSWQPLHEFIPLECANAQDPNIFLCSTHKLHAHLGPLSIMHLYQIITLP